MDSLRTIILTLTPSEKRYFGMFASAFKTESGLMKLFKLTGEKQEYDEKTLIKKTGIKNISEGRSRLRNLLFKAMRSYNEDRSAGQQLRDTISDVDFLERKNLDGEARKEINKALKLAEKNDEFILKTTLLDLACRNMETTVNPEVLFPRMALLQEQLDFSIEEGAHLLQSSMISSKLRGIMRSANFSSPPEIAERMSDLKTRIRALLPLVKTPNTRIYLLTMYIFFDDESDFSEEYCAEVLDIYQQNPTLAAREPLMYDKFLNAYCRKIVFEKEYREKSYELLQKIETSRSDHNAFLKKHPDKHPKMQRNLTMLKLAYCHTHYDWTMLPGLEARMQYELKLEPGKEDIGKAINSALLIFALYINGNYTKALEWASNFYTLPEASFRKPLMIGVRTLEAFAFYKLRQHDVSENKAINLYKTIAEQRYADDYHKHLGTVLRKLNTWNLKDQADLSEIKLLAGHFATLRKNNDRQYINYLSFLQPEEILNGLLP